MNPELIRSGGMSFEQWVEANDLSKAAPEEVERFQSAFAALQSNTALKYLLNGMEIEAMSRVYTHSVGEVEAAYQELQAVKRFRRILEKQIQDRSLALQKRGK